VPRRGRGLTGAPIAELDRAPLLGRLPEHVERRLVGREPRLGDVERRDVERDPERGQLAHRLGGRLGQPGVLPDAGGQPDDGGLVGLQGDVRQREAVRADPVAGLVVEERVHVAHLDRDAQAAQLLLVALEHLLEPLARGVRVEDRADPVLADVVPLDEEHDEQVEQALALARGRPVHLLLLPPRSATWP
jgi:hypothetical protein